MTDEKRREVLAALEASVANHGGELPDQEHNPKLLVDVAAEVAEQCGVTQHDVLEVNRERWQAARA